MLGLRLTEFQDITAELPEGYTFYNSGLRNARDAERLSTFFIPGMQNRTF